MLRSHVTAATLAVVGLGIWAGAGCGGSTQQQSSGTTGSSTSTGSSSSGSSGYTPAEPPDPPTMMVPPDGTGSVTIAISKLFLGDTDRNFVKDKSNAWKDYGFDLDKKNSTKDSTDLCKPVNNAPKANVYADGNNGIDNSFGHNIVDGFLIGVQPDLSQKISQSIADGSFTIMIDMQKLGKSATYNPVLSKLYGGANLGAPAKFDGTDKWPVIPELLSNPMDITTSKVQFPASYLVNNVWVSGPTQSDIVLAIAVAGYDLSLTIHQARIAMKLDEGHAKATEGIIGGILDTDELTAEIQKIAGSIGGMQFCSGSTIMQIISEIEQASDIMKDGTQDPTKPCNGISIGLGFEGAAVQLGPIAPKSMPKPDPCKMGM